MGKRTRCALGTFMFGFLLVLAGDAWAAGIINCVGPEVSDRIDIPNGGADGNTILIIVAATSEFLGGSNLDPRIDVQNLTTGAFIACNDDAGDTFGGCSLANTVAIAGASLNAGPTPLVTFGEFDSAVIFVNPPGGARVTIRASPLAGKGQDCGPYTVMIFGAP